MSVHFSSRVDISAPNPIAAAEAAAKANGIALSKLNDSNPTRHGLAPELVPSVYTADPRGPRAAREALAAFLNTAKAVDASSPQLASPAAGEGRNERHAAFNNANTAIEGVDPDALYLLSSTSEAYSWLIKLLCDAGDAVLAPKPGYPLIESIARLECVDTVEYQLQFDGSWFIDIAELERLLSEPGGERIRALVLINPNNPTGALYPREVLQQIVDIAREHQLIIFSDEIYDRLVMDGLQHISIASMAPDLFCVTFSGLSKSHMIAGYRIGWMILSGNKRIAKDYIEGLNMLANMRMCSNVPAQSVVQTALGGHQSVNDYIVPGGRVHDQRDLVYDMLNQIPGITAVKPKAAFYIFPKIDVKRFNIHSDEQFALDLLHDKHILISHGGAFNWHRPDHFRVVYLPRMGMLRETMGEISDFFSYYWQS